MKIYTALNDDKHPLIDAWNRNVEEMQGRLNLDEGSFSIDSIGEEVILQEIDIRDELADREMDSENDYLLSTEE